MASNTKNVKLGVCKVIYDGVDLGYTKGGVEVTVKTDTHKVNVDQFGKTSINEYIMGRDVMAKVPLAETTLENMVAIMPGAVLTATGGTVASGTITLVTQPVAAENILVNGAAVTFVAALTGVADEVLIGGTTAITAANLLAALNASETPAIAAAQYTLAGLITTVKYGNQLMYGAVGKKSVEGNTFTLAVGTAGVKFTVSGAALAGGADATAQRVDVTSGIGVDLLSIAKVLRLHPVSKLDTDKTEDFVIPLAGTAGALKFAYKLEDERVYDVDFTGYPDPVSGKLFYTGA